MQHYLFDSDLLLLLSRAQTPDRSLGEFGRSGVAVDLVQQGRVELPLCVDDFTYNQFYL